MKVYIITDIEGITGTVVQEQITQGAPRYEWGCRMMVGDINAAIEGSLAAGADEIVVSDQHGSMSNIFLDQLNPAAQLISGTNRAVEHLEELKSADVVFLVGFHAKSGTALTAFDHTVSSLCVDSMSVNGIELGETEFMALLAGSYGIPVALLTGDEVTCQMGRESLGDGLETVAVKRAMGRECCVCLHPEVTWPQIRDAAQRATDKASQLSPFCMEPPFTLDLALFSTKLADQAAIYPFASRTDGRTVRVVCQTVVELHRTFTSLLALARQGIS